MISKTDLLEILNNNKEPFGFDKLEKSILEHVVGSQDVPDLTYLAKTLKKISDKDKFRYRYQYNKLLVVLALMESKGLCALDRYHKMHGLELKRVFQSMGALK